MSAENLLRVAYAANIVILVPVALTTLFSNRAAEYVFEGRFDDARVMRMLVGCLWAGILVASVAGLVWPIPMQGVLLVQIVYEALFLALVIVPLWVRDGAAAVPIGLTSTFVLIVAIWPILLWRAQS